MKTALVVCTANICRSPMAAALLRRRLEQAGLAESWRVQSAGTWAFVGSPAADHSVAEMAARDLDISDHRSQAITAELLGEMEVVLVMTQNHKAAICAEFPEAAAKVHLMSELAGTEYDIADPVGGPRAAYAACAQELEQLIDAGLAQFLAWAGE